MEGGLFLKVNKKSLTSAFKALSAGAKMHRKYAKVYSIAFMVSEPGKISVLVPGGEYIIDAETSGKGCFSLNYKQFKMLVQDCKKKNLELKIESGLLTVNHCVSVRVKQCAGSINVPLSLSYSAAELARMDLARIGNEVLDFWGLSSQIEDAKSEIDNALDKAYMQLEKYWPPTLTPDDFKALLKDKMLFNHESRK